MKNRINQLCEDIFTYLCRVQDFTPGEYYGAFWSEKAYHAPLLDWHGGGAHHHRGAGSAALALFLSDIPEHQRRAELAFDWLVSRQDPRGGWFETQNCEKSSDWEYTGLEELSNIETAFAVRGLALALRHGLTPKKSYLDAMKKAGLWYIALEAPTLSGVFPHHERSPYDTLNATMHAVEALAAIYSACQNKYHIRINIFLAAAQRGLRHLAGQQSSDGSFPYRSSGGITINYTALVTWLLLNTRDILPPELLGLEPGRVESLAHKAADFLCQTVLPDGSFEWEPYETSCAKHNIWTYVICWNVLQRLQRKTEADQLLQKLFKLRSPSGLLPMRDCDEEITECAYMQADILLFLLPFSK
ncbi:MAG: hypothetical protein WCT05_07010 [Lentisphaeria bacterium]